MLDALKSVSVITTTLPVYELLKSLPYHTAATVSPAAVFAIHSPLPIAVNLPAATNVRVPLKLVSKVPEELC